MLSVYTKVTSILHNCFTHADQSLFTVKQEIFLTDVTNCVTSLKKVVQDLRSAAAQNGQLEMANPVARLVSLIQTNFG